MVGKQRKGGLAISRTMPKNGGIRIDRQFAEPYAFAPMKVK